MAWPYAEVRAKEREWAVRPCRIVRCSPRHRMPFDSRNEGSTRVSMTWRLRCACPWRAALYQMKGQVARKAADDEEVAAGPRTCCSPCHRMPCRMPCNSWKRWFKCVWMTWQANGLAHIARCVMRSISLKNRGLEIRWIDVAGNICQALAGEQV
jgi:hypothetical protein